MKILEENTGSKISGISQSNIFSDILPCDLYHLRKGKQKKIINKWDYIKLKSFAQRSKPLTK